MGVAHLLFKYQRGCLKKTVPDLLVFSAPPLYLDMKNHIRLLKLNEFIFTLKAWLPVRQKPLFRWRCINFSRRDYELSWFTVIVQQIIQPSGRYCIATDNPDTSEPLIILVFVFSRWHLIARTMPTFTIIKHFDVIKNIASGFFPRSVDVFLYPFTLQ